MQLEIMVNQENKNPEHSFPILPPSPVIYLSIMRTKEGKPVGIPIWTSFDNRSDLRSLESDAMSSTFLSLAKNVSDMTKERGADGKIVRITINNRTYNIYLPHKKDDFQISFVIVFEEKDTVLIEDKHKRELVQIVAGTLRDLSDLRKFIELKDQEQIPKSDSLYNKILDAITQNIKNWDEERVQSLIDLQKQQQLEQQKEDSLSFQDENYKSDQEDNFSDSD